MYHYIDESGHSGSKLFKDIINQPKLYYGVLTAPGNLDDLIYDEIINMRRLVGVNRLHANQLGNGGLFKIADKLISIQNRLKLSFDIFWVDKRAHSELCFFDQVFDSYNNKAVHPVFYMSPFRYNVILQLFDLFSAELSERAWNILTDIKADRADKNLSLLCYELLAKVNNIPESISKSVIKSALDWACKNPSKINYSCTNLDDIKDISPNIVGFQFVLRAIARRSLLIGKKADAIIVDRQIEFNMAQKRLSHLYALMSEIELTGLTPLNPISFKGMNTIPLDFRAGDSSVGLELVDIYLWIFKRVLENKEIAEVLIPIFLSQRDVGFQGFISYKSIEILKNYHVSQCV